MTDYFNDLADPSPVAVEITHGKKKKTVHFRRLTAGERLQLVTGQKLNFGGDGQRGAMEMDLGDVSRNRHLLVQFATVKADGVQVFGSLADVQSQPDWLITELANHANAVNDDTGEAGNA